MELGFSREQATFILSLVALIGLVGSFFVGYMDERLGTKKSMLFFGIWYALSPCWPTPPRTPFWSMSPSL